MNAITQKQQRLLDFIVVYRAEHGRSPSTEEMAVHMGGVTRQSVYEIISRLEKKGRVIKHPGVPRGVIPLTTEGERP